MSSQKQSHALVPMLIIGALFFIFGFVTWLNGALIPFLQIVCELTEPQALLVAFTFYIAYVVMALPMSFVLEKIGYKNAMALGLVKIALGSLLFIPAAQTQAFGLFLFAQFVMGTGLTILQTASNPYIVKIGPVETAAVRISIMGLLNKFAGFLAPIVFTILVLGDFSSVTAQSVSMMSEQERTATIDSLSVSLIYPYLSMAIVLFVLAILLKMSSLPELVLEEENVVSDGKLRRHPQLILGAITLFMYVGVEVIAGDTIGLYGSQIGVENATALTSYTMAFMIIGYLLGLVVIPKLISQSQALFGSALLGIIVTLLLLFSDDKSTLYSDILWSWMGIRSLPDPVTLLALLGLANALVWPAVWPLALSGLGKLTAKGSALLIMGISGGAVLPLAYGFLAEHSDSQSAYWMLLPCYAFILYYALIGSKKRAW